MPTGRDHQAARELLVNTCETTCFATPLIQVDPQANVTIDCQVNDSLKHEAYTLSIQDSGIVIKYVSAAGLFMPQQR